MTAESTAEFRSPRRYSTELRAERRPPSRRVEERWRAIALSTLFFLIVAVFWIVKPVKRGLLLAHHDVAVQVLGWTFEAAQLEQLAKVGNVFVALAAVVLFTRLARRLERRWLMIVLCGAMAIAFAVFGAFVSSPGTTFVWSLYIFGDVYATLMVGTFWSLTSDLTRNGEAERWYGIIGFGGVLGGFVGATVVRSWVEVTGRQTLLLGCAATLLVIALVAVWVDHRAARDPSRLGEPLSPGRTSAWLAGAALVLRSRYLLALVGLVTAYEVVSSIIDFQLSTTVARSIAGSTAKDAFFGLVGQIVGVVSIVVQLSMTSWVMRRLGLGIALLILPVAILGGSIAFLVVPTLWTAAAVSTSDNALSYSMNQSAREALYVPLTRREKYEAKAFIDMFVQRAAKATAVVLNLLVSESIGMARVRWLSVVVIALVGVWLALVRWVSRRHATLAATAPG